MLRGFLLLRGGWGRFAEPRPTGSEESRFLQRHVTSAGTGLLQGLRLARGVGFSVTLLYQIANRDTGVRKEGGHRLENSGRGWLLHWKIGTGRVRLFLPERQRRKLGWPGKNGPCRGMHRVGDNIWKRPPTNRRSWPCVRVRAGTGAEDQATAGSSHGGPASTERGFTPRCIRISGIAGLRPGTGHVQHVPSVPGFPRGSSGSGFECMLPPSLCLRTRREK